MEHQEEINMEHQGEISMKQKWLYKYGRSRRGGKYGTVIQASVI